MAIWYVNAMTGNNSNSGASAALAKLTLAGVNAVASAGDTIYASGIFYEAVPVKQLFWIADGYAEFNGNGITAGGSTTAGTVFRGITFANFSGQIFTSANMAVFFFRCVFKDSPYALNASFASGAAQVFEECEFYNLSSAAFNISGGAGPLTLRNCVFSGNPISVRFHSASTSTVRASNCIFRDAIFWELVAATNIESQSNDNAYDFTIGKAVVAGVDKTSLASFVAALTSPRESRSVDQTFAALGDPANYALRTNPGGDLLTAALGGRALGLVSPAVTLSDNENSALWTGGVFSNTEIDGNGYIVLSAGQTEGYWRSDVIDFGAAIPAQRVEIVTSGEIYPTAYIDYDTGDSPGYINIRVRGSNSLFAKGDGSPSWTTVPRNAEIGAYMSNHLRYWQIEITLREP